MPRVRDTPYMRSRRRPHLDPTHKSHTVFCYCTACDEKVESSLPVRLSKMCDCDQYTRWICLPCKVAEEVPITEYYRSKTKSTYGYEFTEFDGMWLEDDQHETAVSSSGLEGLDTNSN